MSSFKRKAVSKQTDIPAGSKHLPGSSGFITSTGIPSLDDILGGGLPLGCSQLILAPDMHSGYGELVQKYFVSQGLASGQDVCVVHQHPREFVEGCMWTPGGPSTGAALDDEEEKQNADSKVKIAWRYEQMKQFQTTITSDQYVRSLFHRASVEAAALSFLADLETASVGYST
jgi:elongator complex protein 4